MDRLEDDLTGQASVIRIDFLSDPGRDVAREHDVSVIPALLVFDGQGNLILKQEGRLDTDRIRQKVYQLNQIEEN